MNARYGKIEVLRNDSIVSKSLRLYGEWAQLELNLLEKFIPKSSIVIDVGCFVGSHSRAFSSMVGKSGRIIAFEARKTISDIALRNSNTSTYNNITVINSGLGRAESLIDVPKIDLSRKENFGALKLKVSDHENNLETVKLSTLDSFKINRADFIKIDVEGMEADVLEGAAKTITKSKPVIFTECNSVSDGLKILAWAHKNKYKVYASITAAFNANNFNSEEINIFGDGVEVGFIMLPIKKASLYETLILEQGLSLVEDIDNLIYIMLHKPQYSYEVLANTTAAKNIPCNFINPIDVKALRAEKEALRAEKEALRAEKEALRAEKEAFFNSRSFRYTKPIRSGMSKLREINAIIKNLISYSKRFYLNYSDAHGSLNLSNLRSGLKVLYAGGNPISVLNSVLKIKKSFGEDLSINHASYIHDFLALNVSVDLIFDHNGGGGTNLYTKQLIKTSQINSKSVIRIWFFERCWFLQIISKHGSNVLLYETSLDKITLSLSRLNINSIIINSLYGSPKIDEIASEILKLSELNNAPISFKVHDFFSACPSPHLVNDKEIYCGIPSDKNICNDCLKNIPNWYHPWIEDKFKANDIDQWRSVFNNIFSRANEIDFFNESAVEIFSRAFLIDKKKIHIKPHKDDYFKPRPINISGKLNIGIIGSLNPIKGINIVRQLGDFIKNEGVDAAITVIGEVSEEMSSDIKIHGKYSVNDLPDLIETYGVNLILFPSIVPETFSYTISEAMKMKLPIVAFNLGAQGQRVSKYNLGKVIPTGSPSEVIFKTIYSLHELRKQDL